MCLVGVDVDVRSGSLVIVTRPGMVVDVGNVTVRSGEVKVRSVWGQQVPVTLRSSLTGTVGSGNITVRPPRCPARGRGSSAPSAPAP